MTSRSRCRSAMAGLVMTVLAAIAWTTSTVSALNDRSNNELFKIIILANGDTSMLNGLLESIASTDFLGDEVSLEIRVGDEQEYRPLSELVTLGFRFPDAVIEKNVVFREGMEGPGSIAAWVDAWSEPMGHALILDVSMKLSPHWYEYVRDAWSQYETRSDLSGISLTRQVVTTSLQTPMRPKQIINNNEPFLFDMVVGPAAFSPHPERWREFMHWANAMSLEVLRRSVPNLMADLIHMKKSQFMFLYHTRKAGGTTMKEFLERVGKKHRRTLLVREGIIVTRKYVPNEKVLSVTTIREPVDRAISSYEFEGRYPIGEKNVTGLEPVDFDSWIDTFAGEAKWRWKDTCWVCSSECFNSWFGGDKKGGYDRSVAMEVLGSFDMVLPMEAMSNPVYVRFLQRVFDATDIHMRHSNPTKEERKSFAISPKQKKRLRTLNRDDQHLVETFMGTKAERTSFSAREWWSMMDEDKMWTMWTQLFTYWCKLNKLHVLYLSPPGKDAMAISRYQGRKGKEVADFVSLSVESDFGTRLPKELNHYHLDGSSNAAITS